MQVSLSFEDFLSMDCLSPFHRHSLLVSIFIARTDDHHDVRRMATLLWKEKLQSGPKAKAATFMRLQRIGLALKTLFQTSQASKSYDVMGRILAHCVAGVF